MATYDKTKADNSAFTEGTDPVYPIGAVVDETSTGQVDEGKVGAPRMSADRILYVRILGSSSSLGADATSIKDGGNSITVDTDRGFPLEVKAAEGEVFPVSLDRFNDLLDALKALAPSSTPGQAAALPQSIAVRAGLGSEALPIKDGGNSITVDTDDGFPLTVRADEPLPVTVQQLGELLAALKSPVPISVTVQTPSGPQTVTIQAGIGSDAVPIKDGGNIITVDTADGFPIEVRQPLGESYEVNVAKLPDQNANVGIEAQFTVSTTVVRLAGTNTARKSLVITNSGTGSLYVSTKPTVASSGAGLGQLIGPRGNYTDSIPGIYTGELWGIYSATASANNVSVSDRS